MVYFRRRGTVSAQRLAKQRSWTTERGDVLDAQEGDWWVVDDAGVGRSVKPEAFAASYLEVSPGRFRRVGLVSARRATVEEVVATLEGTALAEPGMWVVTGPDGDSWPVPDEVFRAGYEAL